MTPVYTEGRLAQIDALRGMAAMSVLLFHYTTRYEQIFVHATPLPFGVPAGFLGVNLFFAISGFVIFMTLHRARSPMDFVVSRFSRLFPTYWMAVLVTWTLLLLAKLPGFQVSLGEAMANLLMVHAFFWVKNVDGVYWSLQVELVFYVWALILWLSGGFRRPMLVCIVWAGLAVAANSAELLFDIRTPYTVRYFLLLDFIPWFIVGIVAYESIREGRLGAGHIIALALAIAAISTSRDATMIAAALGTLALIFAASRQRLPFLQNRAFLFLGAISYPLYLVHEILGWLVIMELESAGVPALIAVVAATTVSIAAAALLHRSVEMPAMAAIRRWHRQRASPKAEFTRSAWTAAACATLVGFSLASMLLGKRQAGAPRVEARLQQWWLSVADCAATHETPVIVVLTSPGPSRNNSFPKVASHIPERVPPPECGTHASPAPASNKSPHASGYATLVLQPLSEGGTRLEDWVRPGPLRRDLESIAKDLAAGRHRVAAVVWQPGEADAVQGTHASRYREKLAGLREILRGRGINAPLLVAKSTHCNGHESPTLRRAVDLAVASEHGLAQGPDLDRLSGEYRRDGCGLNESGLLEAARLSRVSLDQWKSRNGAQGR